MNILFVIDHFGSGGAQRQMILLASELAGRGHHVTFCIYYPEFDFLRHEVESKGIRILHAEKRGRFSLGVAAALRRLFRRSEFDVALAFLATPSFYAELGRFRLGRPALAVSMRSAFFGKLPLPARVLYQFHRLADAVVVNSESHRQAVEQEFPWLGGKLSTIMNGVDLHRFLPLERHKGVRLELLVVGRIGPEKNALGIVEALRLLRESGASVPLLRWAGRLDNSREGKAAHARVLERLDQSGLDASWEWLGEQSDIPQLMARHDALILASFYEGMPNAICEALAAGLPVLASAVCDHPKIVQEGRTGFLFNPHEPASIADTIRRLGDLTEEAYASMRSEARMFAENHLSIQFSADQYERLFERLTSPRASRDGA
jgi:glycosyltransferase involved in cell wall biosynthesis